MFSLLVYVGYAAALVFAAIVLNIFKQVALPAKNEPPVVFHWFPFLGNTISYGMDPYKFLFAAKAKYGDVFTFILLGKKTTVYLGIKGNDFILNGKERDLNAEEVYGPLCNPVFGKDIVYDCPNSKLMEQKKFMKYGLTNEQLARQVSLIENEVLSYIKTSANFKGIKGTVDIAEPMAEITIYTAGRALQGEEVRANLNSDFGHYFHDLEKGFSPINFMLPYVPLPHNRKRDAAHIKMRNIYMDIIQKRRTEGKEQAPDMVSNLMQCSYKNGVKVPDTEIACMLLTLLMAGQHNSSNQACWALLHLANKPALQEELLREQQEFLTVNGEMRPIEFADLDKLALHQNVIKETLRIHNSIHSILRRVKQPLAIPGTDLVIPVGHNVLASPGISAMSEEHFPNPELWDPHRWDNKVEEKEDESELVDYGYGRMASGTKGPYLPFGGGRHRCIGEKFAYVNLTVITATLVRNFKWSTPEGKPGLPPTDYSSLFSCPLQPASIVWERRNPEKVA